MANKSIEMYAYRQVIHRIRQWQSDRAISKTKLMGRTKCAHVRSIARQKGWLNKDHALPDDQQLSKLFEVPKIKNPSRISLTLPHKKNIERWIGQVKLTS